MPASPNVNNYHIGKGIVSFKEAGGSTFVDLGNAPAFVYTPTVEKVEHFSSSRRRESERLYRNHASGSDDQGHA